MAEGRYGRFWEMKKGGPYGKGTKIFKCTDCGAETPAGDDWNGAPDEHRCHGHCKSKDSDWQPGRGFTPRGKANFDRIFPHAPGAGI